MFKIYWHQRFKCFLVIVLTMEKIVFLFFPFYLFDLFRFCSISRPWATPISRIVYDSPFCAFRAFCVPPPAHALARAN